jgi:hypothetical protein
MPRTKYYYIIFGKSRERDQSVKRQKWPSAIISIQVTGAKIQNRWTEVNLTLNQMSDMLWAFIEFKKHWEGITGLWFDIGHRKQNISQRQSSGILTRWQRETVCIVQGSGVIETSRMGEKGPSKIPKYK